MEQQQTSENTHTGKHFWEELKETRNCNLYKDKDIWIGYNFWENTADMVQN